MKFPQFDLGIWFGATKTQVMRAQAYYGMVSIILTAIAARAQLAAWFPWLDFWLILTGIVLIVLIMMAFDFVFMVKSEYGYQAHQMWQSNNPTVDFLKAIEENQRAMMADIALLKEKMGIVGQPTAVQTPQAPFKFRVSDSLPIMPVMAEEERLEKLRRESYGSQ